MGECSQRSESGIGRWESFHSWSNAFGNALGNSIATHYRQKAFDAEVGSLPPTDRRAYDEAISEGFSPDQALRYAKGGSITQGYQDAQSSEAPTRLLAEDSRLTSLRLAEGAPGARNNNFLLDTAGGILPLFEAVAQPYGTYANLDLELENAIVTNDLDSPFFALSGTTPDQLAALSVEDRQTVLLNGLQDRYNNALGFAQETFDVATGQSNYVRNPEAAAYLGSSLETFGSLGTRSGLSSLAAEIPFFVGSAVAYAQTQVSLPGQGDLIRKLGSVGVFSPARVAAQIQSLNAESLTAVEQGILGIVPGGAQLFGASSEAVAAPNLGRVTASVTDYYAGRLGKSFNPVQPGTFFQDKNVFQRGLDIEAVLRGGKDSLGNFPVIDKLPDVNGLITSIKSIDLGAKSRIAPEALERVLNRYVKQVSDFAEPGSKFGTRVSRNIGGRNLVVDQGDIRARQLDVAFPAGSASTGQLEAFQRVIDNALKLKNPVTVKFTPFGT